MKILSRLLLTILPPVLSFIILGSVIILQVSSSGVNQQERDLLSFKALQLRRYIVSQWNILVDLRLYYDPDLIHAAQEAVFEYSAGLITKRQAQDTDRFLSRIVGTQAATDLELIFALGQEDAESSGFVVFSTDETLQVSAAEAAALLSSGAESDGVTDFAIADIGGVSRAYSSFVFEPFNWVVYVSESVTSFRYVQDIIRAISIFIVAMTLITAAVIIISMSRTITRPLARMSQSTQDIIRDIPEIQTRLPIIYNDESGILAENFNTTFAALNRNYQELKKYTYRSIVSQKREARIRNIFQKYVPQVLIDRYVKRPESLLEGEIRDIAVFFMDIRNFTTISESMTPAVVVAMINSVFDRVATQIFKHEGHVDKYIGDAVMAMFGAPTRGANDCANAINAAIVIMREIERLNNSPQFTNMPTVAVGIGVHYGRALVGNIGCDVKIEYTAIGDTVNLASRIESLCKRYQQPILFSANVASQLRGKLVSGWHPRFVDNVVVKGRSESVSIYTVVPAAAYDLEGLNLYHAAVKDYNARKFDLALAKLRQASERIPDDFLIDTFTTRATQMAKRQGANK